MKERKSEISADQTSLSRPECCEATRSLVRYFTLLLFVGSDRDLIPICQIEHFLFIKKKRFSGGNR